MTNVYRKAAKLVEEAPILWKGWMNGVDEKTGKMCYCTMGAVLAAAGRLEDWDEEYGAIKSEWFKALMGPISNEIQSDFGHIFNRIYTWNDAKYRTREEVVELLNRVADHEDAIVRGED